MKNGIRIVFATALCALFTGTAAAEALTVANGKDATLTIGARASGDSGTLTVTGVAEKRSGQKILSVNDASQYTVVLAEALEAAHWKLRCDGNDYYLYRPSLTIVIC